MKAKSIFFSVLIFNLIIGNLVLSGFSGSYETILGRILAHFTFSIVAVLLILLLTRFLKQKHSRITVLCSSVFAAFLVPTISIYVLSAGYGLFYLEFDMLIKGMPIAIISGIVSWFLWLPIGVINSVFFIAYLSKFQENVVST